MNLAKEFKIYCRAVIVNSFNEILLLQKSSNQKIASNQWLLPGGSLEFSETPKRALIRELKEEINFNATNLILLDTDLRIIDQTHWLGLLYKAEGNIQSIKNLEQQKHQKLEWQSINLIEKNLINKNKDYSFNPIEIKIFQEILKNPN